MRTTIIAKTIVFDESGKVLVLRRSDDDPHRPGGTDFPGGSVEEGEDIFGAAVREVEEEAGLKFTATDLQLVFATTKVSQDADTKSEVNLAWLGFVAKLPEGQEVRLSHEHQAFTWLMFDDALKNGDSPTQRLFMETLRDRDLAGDLAQLPQQ